MDNGSVKREINEMKFEFGLMEKEVCSSEEQKAFATLAKNNSLPPEVFADELSGKFIRYKEANSSDVNQSDIYMLLLYKQLNNLRSIYTFLLWLVAIGVIAACIYMIAAIVM